MDFSSSDHDGNAKRYPNKDDTLNAETSPEFRPSQAWIHSKKSAVQSLDFEETESVMWRKVCDLL